MPPLTGTVKNGQIVLDEAADIEAQDTHQPERREYTDKDVQMRPGLRNEMHVRRPFPATAGYPSTIGYFQTLFSVSLSWNFKKSAASHAAVKGLSFQPGNILYP